MRYLRYITNSKDCRALLRNRGNKEFSILLISLHDPWSVKILDLAKKWSEQSVQDSEDGEIFVVNTYDVPEIWGVYSITVAPALMRVRKGVEVLVEYPSIYSFFSTGE